MPVHYELAIIPLDLACTLRRHAEQFSSFFNETINFLKRRKFVYLGSLMTEILFHYADSPLVEEERMMNRITK